MSSYRTSSVVAAVLLILLVTGCAHREAIPPCGSVPAGASAMGYSVQAGAFSRLDNAVRLTRSLETRGIDAFYFAHSSGLYKVRFGNYRSGEEALSAARDLAAAGVLDVYLVVGPGDYAATRGGRTLPDSLRNDLVRTACSFVGIPYRWGSASPGKGLDCSGLVVAVYRLNGLDVPRTSAEQYTGGTPVFRTRLREGDLVFFTTGLRRRVSHVGIYVGSNRFIHAPGTGKFIRTDSLSSAYFSDRYVGARTYLR